MKNDLLLRYFNSQSYTYRIPVTVLIELLTTCNFKCEHCYLPNHSNRGMPTETVKRLLEDLRELGVVSVLFTGGEIFLRDDIFEIVEYARKLHLRVTLLSNASLLDPISVKKLSALYITEFSTTIFSLRPNINDSITKTKGSLSKILANLALLKNEGIKVKIKTPIMKTNAPYIDDVIEYCDRNDFEFMSTLSISLKMNGDFSTKKLRTDINAIQHVLKKIEGKAIMNTERFKTKDDPCPAIFCSLAIDCDGNVSPCNSIPFTVGNIFENTISDIWYHSKPLKQIQSITNDDLIVCSNCEYKLFCDRCPGMALLEGGSLYSCDPLAKIVAQARLLNERNKPTE